MIYFIAAAIFLFFALTILCIFGIISGITGIKELKEQAHPHWGLSLSQLKTQFLLQDRINNLFWSLAINLVFLSFLSVVAYHLLKGPIS
jgi:hypothetical protein